MASNEHPQADGLAERMVQPGKLNEAVETLLNSEKQMRLAADVVGTRKVALEIVQMCYAVKDWKALNENIVLLSKRRAQLKQAVVAIVQEAMTYLDSAPDEETRVELIKTLNNVAAGKMYLEIERARLTKRLAKIKEDQGLIKEAAEIMQEVAVETFGAMAKTEKIAFILEQVRLCLDHEDYMRAQILAKKVNPKVFVEVTAEKKKKGSEAEVLVEVAGPDVPTLPELKVTYYQLMIRYHTHAKDFLEIARCYQSIYDSPSVKEDDAQWPPLLQRICWCLVLAPHGSMQSSLLHATVLDKRLEQLPKFRALLKWFTTMEVIHWPKLAGEYKAEMETEKALFGSTKGKEMTDVLRQRVIEHNILVVAKYYARVTMTRLAQLLDLSTAEAEKHLSDMVVAKACYARVDRPAGIVSFKGKPDGNEVLNKWATSIEKLLGLVETSCHQIHKESMVHKISLGV